MKESVAITKDADAKKDISSTRSDNSIPRLRNEPEKQLGSLRSVIGNIRHDGGTPSVESIATELSVMPYSNRASALLALQQTHGNHYVLRVVTGIQAKLKVGQPGDVYEQEADRVAEQVMRMPEPQVQRQVEEEEEKKKEEEEEEELIQSKENSSGTVDVTSGVESHIDSLRGSGQPLSEAVRNYFEPRFGYDFSGVRIHTGEKASEAAKAVNSRAFTLGNNIVFNRGNYSSGTQEGKKLIAHELTHVVQQTSLRGFIQRQKLVPFEEAEIKPLGTIYSETNRAAHSCISILNKAVKTIYKEELKAERLRSTIQDTMRVLERRNLVGKPTIIEFLDSNGEITKGTKKPDKLSQSVEEQLLGSSAPLNGWYLYGLSIMDGYHSVLIAVHVTDEMKKLHWLDQIIGFKEMTGKLDSEIEKKTIRWWEGVKATKGVGYKTRTTFWPFVRVLGDFPTPSKEKVYA